jgi:hypothetical protein
VLYRKLKVKSVRDRNLNAKHAHNHESGWAAKYAAYSLLGAFYMKLTNDSFIILIGTKNFTERYYRDKTGWLKVSARGRKFRMTAEQILNHVLPAVAGIKPNLTIKVEHHDLRFQNERSA